MQDINIDDLPTVDVDMADGEHITILHHEMYTAVGEKVRVLQIDLLGAGGIVLDADSIESLETIFARYKKFGIIALEDEHYERDRPVLVNERPEPEKVTPNTEGFEIEEVSEQETA